MINPPRGLMYIVTILYASGEHSAFYDWWSDYDTRSNKNAGSLGARDHKFVKSRSHDLTWTATKCSTGTQLRFDHSNERESREIGDLMARVYRSQLNSAIRLKLQTDLESRISTRRSMVIDYRYHYCHRIIALFADGLEDIGTNARDCQRGIISSPRTDT